MNRFLKHTLITLTVIGLVIFAAYRFIQGNLDQLAKTQVAELDLSKVADGTYRGKCVSFPITVVVDVIITDHKIGSIVLIQHTNGQGQGAEALPNKVVAAQSLKVEAVSGATYSSKAMLIAIKNAVNP